VFHYFCVSLNFGIAIERQDVRKDEEPNGWRHLHNEEFQNPGAYCYRENQSRRLQYLAYLKLGEVYEKYVALHSQYRKTMEQRPTCDKGV
jgi:hypothetical protein